MEDEIKMAGEKIEDEVVHANQRCFLDDSLRTTPEILGKGGNIGVNKPKLNVVAKMLRVIIETTKSVSFSHIFAENCYKSRFRET